MGNLGGILGNLYGGDDDEDGDASTPAPAASEEPTEDQPGRPSPDTAPPAWAEDERLDAAFADWNPGPSPDAPAHERELFEPPPVPVADLDMEAALQAALAAAVAAADEPIAPPEAPAAAAVVEEPYEQPDLPPPTLAPATLAPPVSAAPASPIAAALDGRPAFAEDENSDSQPAVDPFDALFETGPAAESAHDLSAATDDLRFADHQAQEPVARPVAERQAADDYAEALDHDDGPQPQVDPARAEATMEAVTVPPPATSPADPYDIPARRETWVRGADDVLPLAKGRRKKK